jgi:Acetoacetate decarboxylase (ADC)
MDRSAFLKAADAATSGRARAAQRAVPSPQSKLGVEPDDVVARALAILAQDNPVSAATGRRQATDVASKVANQPVDLKPTNVDVKPINVASEPGIQSPDLMLQRRILSDGTECSLPIRYFDVQCLVAAFLTEFDRAAQLLQGTGLQAVAQEDGKAVLVLYFIEYRKTDIGPYNEVGLTVLARAPGDPIPASYVVNLPVTTASACRIGREIWGYNKFVAAIDVNSDGNSFSTILRDAENEMICTMEGERGASVPAPPSDILTFTLLDGRLIKTDIQVLTPFLASSGAGFVFKVGPSKHPMASNLRTVALDGARPVVVQYANPLQVLLFPGRPV